MNQPPSPAQRLEYLDGLRAVASVYVVLFHAGLGFAQPDATDSLARNVQRALSFGHDAVAVFIVLSGYCLMLPVARADGEMRRGIRSYFARRAFRILPPYFAALLGSLLLIALVPILETPTKTIWDDTSPAFEPGAVVSHLLIVHNLFPAFVHRINGPLWSVATEWQIYILFPFVLLPVWRRGGALAACGVGFLLGALVCWVAPRTADAANAWYVGLFGMGMAAAGIGFATRTTERTLRERVPWGVVTLLLLVVVGAGVTVFIKRWFVYMPYSDSLVGLTTACALCYLTRTSLNEAARARSLTLRFLESAPLKLLGRFSYSLYLTHLPLVALCFFGLRAAGLAPGSQWRLLTALSVPVSVVAAYAFYWVFERRFVGTPPVIFGRRRG